MEKFNEFMDEHAVAVCAAGGTAYVAAVCAIAHLYNKWFGKYIAKLVLKGLK